MSQESIRNTPFVPTFAGEDTEQGYLVHETEYHGRPAEAVKIGRYMLAWDPVDLEAVR